MPPTVNETALRKIMGIPVGRWVAADLLLARESLGLTQSDLAAAIGYDRSAIAKIENGDASPRLVVELAVRYLADRRLQVQGAVQLEPKMPFDAPRFRPASSPIGLTDSSLGLGLGLGMGVVGFGAAQGSEIQFSSLPAVWFRLLPEFDSGRRFLTSELKRAATQGGVPLVQLMDGVTNPDYVRGGDGFGLFSTKPDERSIACAISYIFDTGEIWSVDALTVTAVKPYTSGGNQAGMLCPENRFKYAAHWFRQLLLGLGLHPPFRWVAGMEGIKCTALYAAPQPGFAPMQKPQGNAIVDVVHMTGIMDESDTPASALRPFFERVFDVFGLTRPEYLDDLANPL